MRFLVFQHHAAEHPGRFRELMRRDGVEWDTVALEAGETIPDLEPYDALLAFGGPMDVWEEREHPWLVAEKAAISRFVTELGRPFLGVCLGHQLLAAALGAPVGKMAAPEVGVVRVAATTEARTDALFGALPEQLSVLQWHGAEVQALPAGGVILASNAACANQAMRVGQHAWGIQYHVEIEDETVAEWGRITEYRKALEMVRGHGTQAELELAAANAMPEFRACASTLYSSFGRVVRRSRQARGHT